MKTIWIGRAAVLVPAIAIAIAGDWTHFAAFLAGGLSWLVFEACYND